MKKQRVIVKIGSSSLTDSNGKLSEQKLLDHVEAIAYLKQLGHDVILISSGAVAAGFSQLGYRFRPQTVAGKQAAAAVGQGLLMQSYISAFRSFGIVIGQLLLTREDFYSRERFHNLFSAISELLDRGVLPIINENDSVSVEELTFGDNDLLSALVSGFLHADALIILTDINGLYDGNPKTDRTAKKYHFLPEITDDLIEQAGGIGTSLGTGGMKSKLLAAQKALSFGVSVFVGTGSGKRKLCDVLEGKGDGTYIGTRQGHMQMRKQWIAYHSQPAGRIEIDEGAEIALLHKGKSLLPVGVTNVWGAFKALDVVEVINQKGEVIGRGQVYYSAEDLVKVKGWASEAARRYSIHQRPEVIHRNHWVCLKNPSVSLR
ncbi:glutamate 5-kinase [Anoxybacillus rupiensis]|uniref:Glutamate 5-kinase n=1 Tax=Anoxybacteroides rupiense TaxID=311460 RepID=A0ABD5IX51_9BACL|nr:MULTISPECIES: glutamate 5-kinase [Anoxybacillus]MBB3908471.1 glutamate 5-kinase [Anoxybacillus rupiensis]MDE8563594.1 glutamate 5-kinase [Anoxybacillus rupiensis]MED5052925.1 glutamate 5-kinase [Anoxybacillus rupiensis]